MTLYIAGSIFIILSIVWWVIQNNTEKKKKWKEAKKDAFKAIDDGSMRDLLDAVRRMRSHE